MRLPLLVMMKDQRQGDAFATVIMLMLKLARAENSKFGALDNEWPTEHLI
jgi:hypothetical protein